MTHTSQVLDVPPKLPPHVRIVRNKTGRPYLYLTRHRGTGRQARSIRLPDDPRSPEFWAEYARHMGAMPEPVRTDTVRALDEAWSQGPEWAALSDGTKREWSRHRRRIVEAWGDLSVKGIAPKHVLALRDVYASTPATANNMLRCLSSMLGWSVPREWRLDNPCREVKPLPSGDAYAPWPMHVVETARVDLIAKGREDLWWVVALALYTGQRLGDCLAMRWSAITPNGIAVTQKKTGKALLIPVHQTLGEVLSGIPQRAVTILTSSKGTPWRGFQTAWTKHRPSIVADSGLVFHGLRKSAVVALLEAGCSEAETAAVTGQSMQMVAHYAKGVNQARLASAAVLKWERGRN